MLSKTSVMYEKGSMMMGCEEDIEGTDEDEKELEEEEEEEVVVLVVALEGTPESSARLN